MGLNKAKKKRQKQPRQKKSAKLIKSKIGQNGSKAYNAPTKQSVKEKRRAKRLLEEK